VPGPALRIFRRALRHRGKRGLDQWGARARARPSMTCIYRIMTQEDWNAFQQRGVFEGSADDRRDGFVHFSRAEQVAGTHEKHYGGKGGLLLLEIDATKLGNALRFEPSRGGALFPHLYGQLHIDAVIAANPLEARSR